MENKKEFLGTEPIGKLLTKMALPTVLAQIINMLYNIVDRIYIGHMPVEGRLALTGVGVCMPIILLVSAFAALITSGGAPRASIYMGKRDYETAEKILGNCFTLLIMISVVLTTVLLLFGEQLLLLFGASKNTIEYAVDYLNIYALGTFFVQMTLGMNMFITAQGFARTGMMTVLIGAVSNIVLDPIFIYGLNLGVRGAALATILSQAISCIWCISFLSGKKTVLRIRRVNLKPEKEIIVACVSLGLAMFIMQSSESILAVCFNSSLLKYGGDVAVGAMTICTSVMQFAMMPMQGIGQGAQPITSYNFGAGNRDRVKKSYFLLLKICLAYSVALWAAIMLFPRFFVLIFNNDPSLVEFTSKVLRIYAAGLCGMGIQTACQMTFVSIGNASCSIVVAIVRKFALLIPLIYLLPHLVAEPTIGVYLAEPIADILAFAFTATLFFGQFRKALSAMNSNQA